MVNMGKGDGGSLETGDSAKLNGINLGKSKVLHIFLKKKEMYK